MLDDYSTIMDSDDDLTSRLATRLRKLRAGRGLTLDALAERSGVSRSMISLIERGASSPTANVLDKLAAGLGVTLASLFSEAERAEAPPVARRADQPEWRDPETGYVRRNLSPPGFASPLELVEVVLPAGAFVAYETTFRHRPLDQQVWVLEGMVEVTLGEQHHHLAAGDCLAMRVDRRTAFRNPGDLPTRYLVALTTGAAWTEHGIHDRRAPDE